MAHGSVVSLAVGILGWLSRLDIQQRDLLAVGPVDQGLRYVYGTIVQPFRSGLATLLNDLVKAAYHPQARQRQIDFDAQPFTIVVVQYVERAQQPAIA